jgi:hypothetical protein
VLSAGGVSAGGLSAGFAGFFCGWGASGTDWPLLFWAVALPANVSSATIEATIKRDLRIVATLSLAL